MLGLRIRALSARSCSRGSYLVHLGLGRRKPRGHLVQRLLDAQPLLGVLSRRPELRDLLLHVVHPRLQAAQLASGARAADGEFLEVRRPLEEELPGHHEARLRGPLGDVGLFDGLAAPLGGRLARGADTAQRLRRLGQTDGLVLGGLHLGVDLLQQVPPLAVRVAGPELLQPAPAIFQALLHHVDLLLDRLGWALGKPRHLDELSGDERLRIGDRGVHLRSDLVRLRQQLVQILWLLLSPQEGQLGLRHFLQLIFSGGHLLRHFTEEKVSGYADLGLLDSPPHLVQLLLSQLGPALHGLDFVLQRNTRRLVCTSQLRVH
mmetsp:Transcript_22445/g.67195  ORF Transcript_22445/g.67195 Transcript_22445/m.67195 type:complete len:319 (+) Transcript_22445:2359-3315(+)